MAAKKKPFELGLALSGGGYRAAAFHLGTMRKLHELGLLHKVQALSTVSGGSLVGAAWLLHEGDFPSFEKKMQAYLKKSVILRIALSPLFLIPFLGIVALLLVLIFNALPFELNAPVRTGLCLLIILFLVLAHHYINPFTRLKIKTYQKWFFGTATLDQLKTSPKIAINATNLETGTLWTFSRDYSGDSTYIFEKIFFKHKGFPVATAVAASTCVPAPFLPVAIPTAFFASPEYVSKARPRLVDGGVYDNQGIHKLTHEKSEFHSRNVIVSDASFPFTRRYNGANSLFVLSRVMNIMMRRIKNLQYARDLLQLDKKIAFFSLDWTYDRCVERFVRFLSEGELAADAGLHLGIRPEDFHLPAAELQARVKAAIHFESLTAQGLTPEVVDEIDSIGTNLIALKASQLDKLGRHAATLTELQVRLYCPHLLSPGT